MHSNYSSTVSNAQMQSWNMLSTHKGRDCKSITPDLNAFHSAVISYISHKGDDKRTAVMKDELSEWLTAISLLHLIKINLEPHFNLHSKRRGRLLGSISLFQFSGPGSLQKQSQVGVRVKIHTAVQKTGVTFSLCWCWVNKKKMLSKHFKFWML